MVGDFDRIPTEYVSAPPLKKRTPRRKSPEVTPVAAKTTFPRAISSTSKTFFTSLIPIFCARSISFSLLDPLFWPPLDLLLVARPEPALHVAAHAADGGGGDHAFRRAPDPHQHV